MTSTKNTKRPKEEPVFSEAFAYHFPRLYQLMQVSQAGAQLFHLITLLIQIFLLHLQPK